MNSLEQLIEVQLATDGHCDLAVQNEVFWLELLNGRDDFRKVAA